MRKRNRPLIDWLAVPLLACLVIVHGVYPANADSASPVSSTPTASAAPAAMSWVVPDIDKLPDDDWGRTVRYGRDLMTKTASLIGPEAADPMHRFAGNSLNCASCHLEAGAKEYGLPYVGAYADFPNYRARSGAVGTIEDRIQGCMARSMNGKKLPAEGPEMTAMVAYLKFLSTGRPVGAPVVGRGSGRMPELTRAADPARGQALYAQTCAVCHGDHGASGSASDAGGGRPRILNPSAMGTGQLQRRRGHGAAYRRSELHPQQYAGWRDVADPSCIG